MKTEAIRTVNTDYELGYRRYGTVRDIGATNRNHLQNAAITTEIDRARVRPRPEALNLTARAFQLELFRRAKTQNTIAVLDTGVRSGR